MISDKNDRISHIIPHLEMKVIGPLILFYSILSVTNGLKCFNCDPKQYPNNDCETDPTNTTLEFCKETDSICISSYLKTTEGYDLPSGVYRGCFKPNNNAIDGCVAYRQEFLNNKNINLMSCSSCKKNLCNDETSLRSAPLKCYNCDVKNDRERCLHPKKSGLKPVEENCVRNDGSADNFVCVSSYLKHKTDANQNGPYRGCFDEGNATRGCDSYKNKLDDYETFECNSCSEKLCNEEELLGDRLICYSCGLGKSFEECSKVSSSMENITCKGDRNEYACVSVYMKPTKDSSEKSTIFRSCQLGKENPCDNFRKSNTNRNLQVSSCNFCNENLCNYELFLKEDDSGAAMNYISISLLIISIFNVMV